MQFGNGSNKIAPPGRRGGGGSIMKNTSQDLRRGMDYAMSPVSARVALIILNQPFSIGTGSLQIRDPTDI